MRPEDVIADRQRPFTGAEYMQSLRDGREVYIDGERVAGRHRASGVSQRGALDRPAVRRAARPGTGRAC